MSMKNPVTSPGIDPGTVRLVAQRLNHYATLGLNNYSSLLKPPAFNATSELITTYTTACHWCSPNHRTPFL